MDLRRLLPGSRRHRRAVVSDLARAALLTEVRAALAAGAAPGPALAAGVEVARMDVLEPVARSVRLGRSLAAAAADVDTGDVALDLLVRALGVAEGTGAGGLSAVDQALSAAAEEAQLARTLRTKTAQARATALLLSVLPVVAWLGIVALDPAALSFYATPARAATAAVAVGLWCAGRVWASRVVAGAETAARSVDPLAAPRVRPDPMRLAAAALPAGVLGLVGFGPPAAVALALAAALIAARTGASGTEPVDLSRGGAAEAVELISVALASGLSPVAAVAAVAPLSPPAARPHLARAADRLLGGWPAQDAFGDGGLAAAGAVLAASDRWGAPAEPALRRLASELRADRRAASEEAGERTQLALVFPMTLLTLPAFLWAVVPPLLWAAFSGLGAGST